MEGEMCCSMKTTQKPSDRWVGRANRGLRPHRKTAEEGGCGVVGYASTVPFAGRHILSPCMQMHNRGNGKGGGIAAVGLSSEDFSISQEELDRDYLIQIALLDPTCLPMIEKKHILPHFDVHHSGPAPAVKDYREIEGLDVGDFSFEKG